MSENQLQTRDNNIYTENSIRTYTGKVFDLKILDPDSICIEDIAHALSQVPRFGGHLKGSYNVAQHSYSVCNKLPEEHQLAGLLHDASEAYLGDMPSPFKKLMPDYKKLEKKLMQVIADKFGFQFPFHHCVKEADFEALNQEWESFVLNKNRLLSYPDPEISKIRFLNRFYKLKLIQNMNQLQSKINAAEARINQIKNSELFTEADRSKLLPKAELELEQLLLEKADKLLIKNSEDNELEN